MWDLCVATSVGHTVLHLYISERRGVPAVPSSIPGHTHDTVTALPWIWGGDRSHMHFSIMSYVVVWCVICRAVTSAQVAGATSAATFVV